MTGEENNIHKRLIAYQDIANAVHLINNRTKGCRLIFKEELEAGCECCFNKGTDSDVQHIIRAIEFSCYLKHVS